MAVAPNRPSCRVDAGAVALVVERVAPVSVIRLGSASWFVDFGRAVFGTVELEMPECLNFARVGVHLGEKALGSNRVDRSPPGSVRYRQASWAWIPESQVYRALIPPDERNTGRQAVRMPAEIGEVLPFRYCELENFPGELTTGVIRQLFVHAPFDDSAAFFESSDSILNEVWDLCRHTIKATTFCGLYVDGDRERIPYEGDAYINQLSHYGLDADYRMGRATLEYLVTNPTWPTDWHLHVPFMVWLEFVYSGDDSFMREHYELLKRKTLVDLARDDGLISTANHESVRKLSSLLGSTGFFGNQDLRDMVDWPLPKGFGPDTMGETDEYVFGAVNTAIIALHYRAIVLLERMAVHLGKEADADFFRKQAELVFQSANSKLFDPVRGIYVDGLETSHASLHANAFSLMAGIVPPEREAGVCSFVRSRGMACSVYGAQHLLDGLYRTGVADYGLSLMTATHDRSWHHMKHGVGSTMTLEAWDPKYKPNLDWNHAWGSAPTNVIIRRLLGVRPGQPGFGRALIEPQLGGLEWVRARVPTGFGPIEIEATHRRNKHPEIQLSLPENTTATLRLKQQPHCPEHVRRLGEGLHRC